jgi:hypothetical protein
MRLSFLNRATFAGTLILFLSFLAFYGCNSEKKKTFLETDCQVLLYDQAQSNWETPGFLRNADTVKFKTTYQAASGTIKVEANLSSGGTIISNSTIELKMGNECAVKLPATTKYYSTSIPLASLKIVDAEGKLKKFNYIRLNPTTVTVEGSVYIAYDVVVVDAGGESSVGKADPCPPICIVPIDGPIDPNDPQDPTDPASDQ